MKNLLNRVTDHPIKIFLILSLFFTAFLTACNKYEAGKPKNNDDQTGINSRINSEADLISRYSGLGLQTLAELQQVHAATAKYQNIGNAFGDSYVDIGLVLPNMGYHILKAELVTSVFDLKKPPILVYNKKNNGNFELVAVEYAIPIDPQSPNTPPEGFTGSEDAWDFNTLNTGWWTLHAWVWKNNPDGVFKPMNPTVIVQ